MINLTITELEELNLIMDSYRSINSEYNSLESEIAEARSAITLIGTDLSEIESIISQQKRLSDRTFSCVTKQEDTKKREGIFLNDLKSKYGTGRLNPFEGRYYEDSTE